MTPKKYICKQKYRSLNGYVFVGHKPVTILDPATLEAIAKDPDFKECREDEYKKVETHPKEEAAPAAQPQPVLAEVVPLLAEQTEEGAIPDACPKCGRVIRVGMYMHAKHCRGVSPQ